MVGDMENYKILVTSESESKEAQDLFFELGYKKSKSCRWLIDCIIDYFATDGDELHCWDSEKHGEKRFNSLQHKQITLQYLRDLVVLKRNDVNDAKYADSHLFKVYIDSNGKVYYFEQRQFNNGQYNTWVESCINNHTLELLKDEWISELKPIEKEVKMKEYLDANYELRSVKQPSGDNHVPNGWIEVPEGAEILYFGKRDETANHFFKTVYGKSYFKYLDKGSEWMEYSDVSLDEFKESLDNFLIMWQRNPETTNTSIQEKLKFIEKWLNGEKIQYILGVESEKTQWHNFTEGAMRYIKRSNIKFREAPKYVTINGIEFKNVERLLKHVKNNFDLEDGE